MIYGCRSKRRRLNDDTIMNTMKNTLTILLITVILCTVTNCKEDEELSNVNKPTEVQTDEETETDAEEEEEEESETEE